MLQKMVASLHDQQQHVEKPSEVDADKQSMREELHKLAMKDVEKRGAEL